MAALEERVASATKASVMLEVGQQLWPAVSQETGAAEARVMQALEQHVAANVAQEVPALEQRLADATRKIVREDVRHLFRLLGEAT
jgi:hypothetical protein